MEKIKNRQFKKKKSTKEKHTYKQEKHQEYNF